MVIFLNVKAVIIASNYHVKLILITSLVPITVYEVFFYPQNQVVFSQIPPFSNTNSPPVLNIMLFTPEGHN